MTKALNPLLTLLDQLKAETPSGFVVSENHVTAIVYCSCSAEVQLTLAGLVHELPEYVALLELKERGDTVAVPVSDMGAADLDQAEIHVQFKTVQGRRPVLTRSGFESNLRRGLAGIDHVLLDEEFEGFAVGTSWVSPWRSTSTKVPMEPGIPVEDLRHLVVEAGTGLLPARINDWVLTHEPKTASEAFVAYARLAWPRLCAFLFNRVFGSEGSWQGKWRGDSGRTISLGAGASTIQAADLSAVSAAIRWIASAENGIDMRHAFLVGELSATHGDHAELLPFLRNHLSSALERAQEAYRLYVNGLTEKTVRAVSDLRKALMEDVGRQVAFSRDLSSQLWKDSALAVAALAAKYLIEPSKAPVSASRILGIDVGSLALIAVLLLVVTHFALTICGNERFYKAVNDNHDRWRRRFAGALGADEYKEMYEQPLAQARGAYVSQAKGIGVIYLVIVVLGLVVACQERPLPAGQGATMTRADSVGGDSAPRTRSSTGSEATRTDTGRGTRSAGRPGG